jgi:6-phosphogluconate dehydrogenase
MAKVVSTAVLNGIPTPAMSAALSYFDGYKTDKLPANLLQAQRDYFGAHTYERSINHVVSFSIQIGQVAVETLHQRLIMCRCGI